MPPIRLILTALLAVVSMSAVPVLVKSVAANEVTIGLFRLTVALLVFLPFVYAGRHSRAPLRSAEWKGLVVIGLVFGVHWLTYFLSIKWSTAAIAAVAIATYGVQYPLLAWLIQGERLTLVDCLAIAMSLVGCVLVSPALEWQDRMTWGIVVGIFSALLYALLPILHQRLRQVSTVQRTSGQFGFALLVFIPLWPLSDWNLSGEDYMRLLTLGLLCTVVAHGLWVKATTELPAIFTSLIYYLYVPLAMLSSAFFLAEPIGASKIVGAVLIIVSSMVATAWRWRLSMRDA